MNTPITDAAQFGTGRVTVDFARRLELDRAALMEALTRIIGDLPQRRDWLDPDLEALARAALSTARANFP